MDKCLKLGSEECVSRILRELLDVTPTGTEGKNVMGHYSDLAPTQTTRLQDKLVELSLDPYGNYIMQACIHEGHTRVPAVFNMLVDVLEPVLPKLKGSACGTRLMSILQRSPPQVYPHVFYLTYQSPLVPSSGRRSSPSVSPGLITWDSLSDDVLVVDVREIEEFENDHYECTHPFFPNLHFSRH